MLDAQPISRLKNAKCLAWLESLRDVNCEEQLRLRLDRRGIQGLSLLELIRETGLTQEALFRQLDIQAKSGKLVRFSGDLFLTKDAVEAAAQAILLRLEMKSNQKGVKLSELRSQTSLRSEVIESLVGDLAVEQKLRRQGEMVYACGTGPQVSAEDEQLQSKIEAVYKSAGLASPSTNEIAATLVIKDDEMRRSMTMLLRDK